MTYCLIVCGWGAQASALVSDMQHVPQYMNSPLGVCTRKTYILSTEGPSQKYVDNCGQPRSFLHSCKFSDNRSSSFMKISSLDDGRSSARYNVRADSLTVASVYGVSFLIPPFKWPTNLVLSMSTTKVSSSLDTKQVKARSTSEE